ncbi:TetR/AcrR family transcriptional regulator [Sinomonas sp.]|jgi:AcrR family transcriptional regulator|uniref:TetR/AcrR family transcriptional regulator n=1 Tax=Sinomonas sp. TaxID=1914986 RepID=UPI003F80FCE0
MMARPKGGSDRRAAIVAAATRLFADDGYDGVSLRQIAREAGVDSALVHHYFEGKEDLFAACVELPAEPDDVLHGIDEVASAERGRFVARAVLRLWDGPQQRALAAFLRGTISSTVRTHLLGNVVQRRILAHIVDGLPGDDDERRLRASLAATQVVGFILVRYVVRLEPLASLPLQDVEDLLAPALQRVLTEPLPTETDQNRTVAKVPTRSKPTRS